MTPKEIALGYGWKCPYCEQAQDEGEKTGVYYFGKPVCAKCAVLLNLIRAVVSNDEPEAAHVTLKATAHDFRDPIVRAVVQR